MSLPCFLLCFQGSGPGCRVPFINLPSRQEQEAVPDGFQVEYLLKEQLYETGNVLKTPLVWVAKTPGSEVMVYTIGTVLWELKSSASEEI